LSTRGAQAGWLSIALAAIAAHGHALSAHAQGKPGAPRVALVEPGAELEAAARAALEPWGVELSVVAGPSPGATAPGSNEAARALASAHGVNALVWVSEHARGYALWVYDRATHHVIERALASGPPFDEPAAAAVALSVKTLLRHSAAAPPAERYGASNPARSDPQPLPAPDEPSPRTTPTAVPSDRDDEDGAEPLPASDQRAFAPAMLELALAGGVRLAATRPGAVEARFAVGVSWWPARGPIGIEAGASAGPALSVQDGSFEGSLFDATPSLALALRHDFARRVHAQAAFEAGLHILALDGVLVRTDQATSDLRATPSLALRVRGDWALGPRVRVGLFAALSYVLRAEQYLVEDRTVLEVVHVGGEGGVLVSFGLLE
jgi:hypothetical protein